MSVLKSAIIFCDNEHGTGDVCFPDLDDMDSFQVKEAIKRELPLTVLRKDAKAAGWGRVNGGDYCPACMESGI